MYEYSVKIIKRSRKSEYVISRLRGCCSEFGSVDELKFKLLEALPDRVSVEMVGYIEPDHGVKGKQR